MSYPRRDVVTQAGDVMLLVVGRHQGRGIGLMTGERSLLLCFRPGLLNGGVDVVPVESVRLELFFPILDRVLVAVVQAHDDRRASGVGDYLGSFGRGGRPPDDGWGVDARC